MAEPDTFPRDRQRRGPVDDLREIMGTSIDDDLVDVPGPTHWPDLPAADAPAEWEELRRWVEELCARFPHLDHHVVPRCWWRHNQHVEALCALRDHERSSFADTAPATASVEWFRALRDITGILRAWTAELACGTSHQGDLTTLRPVDADEWGGFVAGDVAHREAKAIEEATR